ncbi:MAG: hypothetical protein M0Z71_05015 [Nitrospiraceae bacterium]|nr:hypothetical protein [Nitrospiraceae bacterium]
MPSSKRLKAIRYFLNGISYRPVTLEPFLVHTHQHGDFGIHIIVNSDNLFAVVEAVETTGTSE